MLYVHLTRELGFSERFYGGTVTLTAVASIAASLAYGLVLPPRADARAGALSIALGVFSALAYATVTDGRSVVAVTLAVGAAHMTATLIQLDLAAQACPPEAAGTVFALLMALENLSISAGAWLGGGWYDAWAGRWGSRAAFRALVAVGAATTACCWLLVPLLPRGVFRGRGGPSPPGQREGRATFGSNSDWVRTIALSSGKVWKAWIVRPRTFASIRTWLIAAGAMRLLGEKRWNSPPRSGSRAISSLRWANTSGSTRSTSKHVWYSTAAAGPQRRRALVADRRMVEQAGLGQERLGAREDLGQPDRPGAEDDRVPPLDDPDVGLPAVLRDPAMRPHGEPVGVDRPAEDLEGQVGDPRPPEAHPHARNSLPLSRLAGATRTSLPHYITSARRSANRAAPMSRGTNTGGRQAALTARRPARTLPVRRPRPDGRRPRTRIATTPALGSLAVENRTSPPLPVRAWHAWRGRGARYAWHKALRRSLGRWPSWKRRLLYADPRAYWTLRGGDDYFREQEGQPARSGRAAWIAARVASYRPASILEVGCGYGKQLRAIRRLWDVPMVGVDFSPTQIARRATTSTTSTGSAWRSARAPSCRSPTARSTWC